MYERFRDFSFFFDFDMALKIVADIAGQRSKVLKLTFFRLEKAIGMI